MCYKPCYPSTYLGLQYLLLNLESAYWLTSLSDLPSDSWGQLYPCMLPISIKNHLYARRYMYLILWGLYVTYSSTNTVLL